MAEVIVQLARPVIGEDGRSYIARVCGRVAEDGLWEGWVEFDAEDGSTPLRTPRETDQPKRSDLEYWATGLTETYLEGALERAIRASVPGASPAPSLAKPAYPGPAPGPTATRSGSAAPRIRPHGVLNPFGVFRQGEDLLRRELSALHESHLRNIIAEHELAADDDATVRAMLRPALVELIVAAVKRRVAT